MPQGKTRKVWNGKLLSKPAGRSARPGSPALAESLRAVTAEVESLKERLAQMEARQEASTGLRPAEPTPAGMTPMQSIRGQLDVEETTEELLAQLKALD